MSLSIIETNAIEEAMILGDFSLANQLEINQIMKLLPVVIDNQTLSFSEAKYEGALFKTKVRSSGKLKGLILVETIECHSCQGTGKTECCECRREQNCEDCDGTKRIHAKYKDLTMDEFYELLDQANPSEQDNH